MSEKESEEPARKSRTPRDPELRAIASVTRVLEPLDQAQRRRVLVYLCERYATQDVAAQKLAAECKFPGLG